MKKHIVDEIRQTHGISTSEAETAFDRVVGGIQSVLRGTGEARLPGVGTLKRSHRAERQGRNPATGESLTIAGKDVVKFKQAKDAL